MAITEKQLLSDLKAQHFKPIYLLTGEENYYIDLVADYFENNIVAEECRDFDLSVVYGKDVDIRAVVSLAQQCPMLSPRKVVLVREAQDMSIKSEKEWDTLVSYLDHPTDFSSIALCYKYKSLDKRTKAFKAIDKVGVVFEKKRLYDNEVPGWIATYVYNNGFQITEKGASLIAEFLGNDLGKIVNELSKLFIGLEPGVVINESFIERNIGISKDYNVFELQKAIGRRDVVKCNRIVNYFAANPKSNPIQKILPLLYSYFIKVMIYIQEPDKTRAASALKIPPSFVSDYAVAANNYTLGKLVSCIGYLYDVDLRSKGVRNSGTVTDGELLKELVFKIIH